MRYIGRLIYFSLVSLSLSAAPCPAQLVLPNNDGYNDLFREYHRLTAVDSDWNRKQQRIEYAPALSAQKQTQIAERLCGKKLKPATKAALTRGLEYAYRHEYERSIPYFNQVLAESPHHGVALLERSEAQMQCNKYADALVGLNVLMHDEPNVFQSLRLRSSCYFELKQFDKCLNDCSLVIKLEPTTPQSYRDRAKLYRQLHRDAEARADDAQARRYEMPVTAQDMIANGRLHEALAVLNTYVAENPRDPLGYDQRSYLLIALGKYKDAVNDCTKLMDLSPNLKEHAQSLRAKAYDNLGQLEKAVDDYACVIKKCVEILRIKHQIRYPQKPPIPLTKSQILSLKQSSMLLLLPQYLRQEAMDYIQLKRFAAAISDCNKLILLTGWENAEAYSLRADAYAAWGENKKALDDYNTALRLNPKSTYLLQQTKELAKSLKSAH